MADADQPPVSEVFVCGLMDKRQEWLTGWFSSRVHSDSDTYCATLFYSFTTTTTTTITIAVAIAITITITITTTLTMVNDQ
ncbi:hypothetical protein K493DRAFT_319927 [Basidiobolus meristosporus CBS 931.73]|uniref:Uncharacterized protein n=1 Tax=Basidiobolus meristosporus CBS 931.73 TaxID=1314790 RepID=A0A1Y1XJM0_9FUNG|nr:hypothetical protein K493DRAFT_319927 [Basidiobolus meristosporus CBS 931.73]|eukprot:ORX85636.1 hypothetical protein K493DRAFT_319927 [Basidiobolus meristosporus CBS 931.73]